MAKRATWSWGDWGNRLDAGATMIALALIVGVLVGPRDAAGQIPDSGGSGDDDPPGLDCLTETRGTLSATPQAIYAHGTATLHWSVQAPADCGAVVVKVDGLVQPRTGTMSVSGIDNQSVVLDTHLKTTYKLKAHFGRASRELASTVVDVYLPVVANRPQVRITANHQAALLKLALQTPNAFVFVENQVALDMTGRTPINVAEGVHLKGGRTAREPGGLLFMRPAPLTCEIALVCPNPNEVFLDVWDSAQVEGDSVRISGLRISGTEMGSAADYAHLVHGIQIHSRINVEIDNNELFGWRGSAVKIEDRLDRICHSCPAPNSATIHVHHNYIHHNQHDGGNGYGVDVMHGAYALIEKNVFDYNRHAIAAGGQPYTGYLAYRNLVLENGGFHNSYAGYDVYTHQFDMHGTETCFPGHLNCGDAGEFMDIAFNSFFYTKDNAFKLRGKPNHMARVRSNVFAHDTLVGVFDPALGGYIEHMQGEDNLTGINESGHYGHCDFDADGRDDLFLATGQTWWFNSGGDRHWIFLNTSKKRLGDVTLGDVTGDGRCDVVADGVVSSGGTGWSSPTRHSNLVWRATDGQVPVWTMDGATVVADTRPGVMDETWQVQGLADFSGDGHADILWRDVYGRVSLWEMADGNKLAERYGTPVGGAWTVQGTGDFDGDGVADVLWRDATGQLAIWFKGEYQSTGAPTDPSAVPAAYPGYNNVPAPVDLAWTVIGVGDFDGDGRSDILWRHRTGTVMIWNMIGGQRVGESSPGAVDPAVVQCEAVADFDADGRSDILWRDSAGALAIWFGGDATRVATPGTVELESVLAKATDFDGDGRADIVWRNAYGRLLLWRMAGGRILGQQYLPLVDRSWQLAERVVERTREAEEREEVDSELPVERRPRSGLP